MTRKLPSLSTIISLNPVYPKRPNNENPAAEKGDQRGCGPGKGLGQRAGIEIRFGLDGEAVSVADLFKGTEEWLPVEAREIGGRAARGA